MKRHVVIPLIPGILMTIFYLSTATAASLETLMMPGEVIQGHAKYENDCKNCHVRFSKTNQNELCLKCHKKIAGDVNAKEGFHGHIKDIGNTECKSCHTEHKGRKADIVLLDKETFDHDATDYPLKGAHTHVKCGSCHKPKARYREAPAKCYDCHKSDDPHRESLGKDCAKCHNEQTWKKVKFDHDKTDFPLKGKHKETTCEGCHPNERYKDIPVDCISCHRINDVHDGRYGEKCKNCHTAEKWKDIIFSHNKDTKYRLEGKHIKVTCDSCHRGKLYGVKLGSACFTCHKNDDYHKGRYGQKCQTCHSFKNWTKAVFDHDKKTDYPLRGKHKKVECQECHKGNAFKEKLATECYACHRLDDKHRGQEGKRCERCHNEDGWGHKVVFDHDLTHFPLIGQHAITACEECHLSASFKGAPIECVSCHKSEDTHKQRLGDDCGTCHNPNGWKLWRFDHNNQTDYKLDGKHEGLDCHACHKSPAPKRVRLSTACSSCHQDDDAHGGRFGQRCERCHMTKSFKEIALH